MTNAIKHFCVSPWHRTYLVWWTVCSKALLWFSLAIFSLFLNSGCVAGRYEFHRCLDLAFPTQHLLKQSFEFMLSRGVEPWAPLKSATFPSKGTGIMTGMGCPLTSGSASEPSALWCWCPSTSLLQYHSVLLIQSGKLESLVVLVLYVHFFRAALVFYAICISTQILDSVCQFLQKSLWVQFGGFFFKYASIWGVGSS